MKKITRSYFEKIGLITRIIHCYIIIKEKGFIFPIPINPKSKKY